MPDEKPPTFNPNIPVVQSLNSYALEKDGWKRSGSTYTKGKDTVIYTGVHWLLNGVRVEFLEDLKK